MLKRVIYIIGISLGCLLLLPKESSSSWGFYGHQRINRMAVFTLPPEMLTFYKYHIEFITNHAVDPDKRRYGVEGEAARHYIDIDHYGEHAFDSVPKYWKAAVAKYTEDTLMAYGIVPWQIEKHYYKLLNAFKDENADRILTYSAELGHYIADAHVPLHTTENYNGQLTGQRGIHGFWESRIPELKAEGYDYFVGRAGYIDSPIKSAWKIVYDSHLAVDSVLKFEAKLNKEFSQDKKYAYENRGNVMMKVYSEAYANRYDLMIKGQVERRMRESIVMVGNLWYTAWVNAGKPNLETLGQKEISDSLKLVIQQEEELYMQQKHKSAKGHDD
ncbi:MAG: S1/P1 Nuclease [Bacteroidetes bacterium]|nr:S1/P1 Nuclease [Bacteroidota bacterium]